MGTAQGNRHRPPPRGSSLTHSFIHPSFVQQRGVEGCSPQVVSHHVGGGWWDPREGGRGRWALTDHCREGCPS